MKNKDLEIAIDPEGYAIAAAKILDALKLVIGQDVNEFSMPVIITIMKNNIRPLNEYKIKLKELINFEIALMGIDKNLFDNGYVTGLKDAIEIIDTTQP